MDATVVMKVKEKPRNNLAPLPTYLCDGKTDEAAKRWMEFSLTLG